MVIKRRAVGREFWELEGVKVGTVRPRTLASMDLERRSRYL